MHADAEALFLDHHAVTPGEGLGDQLLRRIERLRPVGPRDRAADRAMFGAVTADHHQRLAAIADKAIELRDRSAADERRTEARRVGKEGVNKGRPRRAAEHKKKKK